VSCAQSATTSNSTRVIVIGLRFPVTTWASSAPTRASDRHARRPRRRGADERWRRPSRCCPTPTRSDSWSTPRQSWPVAKARPRSSSPRPCGAAEQRCDGRASVRTDPLADGTSTARGGAARSRGVRRARVHRQPPAGQPAASRQTPRPAPRSPQCSSWHNYRVTYRMDEDRRAVAVVAISPRADSYRSS
jgi:hypothetical protein